MREHKLYANVSKCIVGAEEIPFLGCFIGKDGVRADPAKVKAIVECPSPVNLRDLRKWLGLANYIHKYSENYAEMAKPLTDLLKKDVDWCWKTEHQNAFEAVKGSLLKAPVLSLPDSGKPFSVLCDSSYFAIGCALLQADDAGRERVIVFESMQLKASERNYPVHDKELLAMKYDLVKFRVHLLGSKPFVVYTDHASLRTATKSPHLSQRMARWLSFFEEYNFEVKYKPGKQNVLANALSRRPDYELAHATFVTTSVVDLIRQAYEKDPQCTALISALGEKGLGSSEPTLSSRAKARLHRYRYCDGLLFYSTSAEDTPRVVVLHNEELKYRVLFEAHYSPIGGHLGRDKTYSALSALYWWPNMYKWVGAYIRTCETCQRVKPSASSAAPLASLSVPTECWKSIIMDFIFGFPNDKAGNTGILVFVDRLSKMAHLAAVPESIDGQGTAKVFLDRVFRQHGLPDSVVSDPDPRFTGQFWGALFKVLGTKLLMSTEDHPQTDGQTERVNRVVEDILRSLCPDSPKIWSEMLPMVEFAINDSVHASTVYTVLRERIGESEGSVDATRLTDVSHVSVRKHIDKFLSTRLSVLRQVCDAMAESQDKQKEKADRKGRRNKRVYKVGESVLLNAKNLPSHIVSNVLRNKLRTRFVGPFKVLDRKGLSYTLEIPKVMRTHPTFYVGMLKPYQSPEAGPLSEEGEKPDRRKLQQVGTSPTGLIYEPEAPQRESLERQAAPRCVHSHSPRCGVPPEHLGCEDCADHIARGSHAAIARPPPPVLDTEGTPHYHVERLMARRHHRGETQYLAKWKGYPHSQNSWEYETPLRQYCRDVVDALERENPTESQRPKGLKKPLHYQ
ncbi:hypothetical protein PsorP6_002840 [Peronosclerospora sorghi]|uniref:Uncharacterized protein n=1 Tax=Peronosclerospora sorghi TaxID=230839 RepID=A0ACC0VJ51_9STRA|nr:hypothetical protein PsorP6_002840 [Peronosclerospora sorghi]